ncbi:TIM barrel protein [Pleomorphomonas carboxyditropha]|uniref:Hydroxypyruvate isomerase n=1 Tax=Pleomorphomonas carboxyditropha TaxID=2023338 RepID=A0A2G9X2N9_9HYPH|nr:TIM barrel protein [Pleomorphomonas carboxyditropha]PIP01230.1 hydroxypyruvate isomerase [Pleomorphomonas carboxyditropha]
MKFSACIEWLFADEAPDFADRIRFAHRAGLDAVEFWLWSNKDLAAVEAAVHETGIAVTGFVAEPMVPLTDPANREAFIEGLAKSIDVGKRLGAKVLIAQAGNDLPGRTRGEQRAALVATLKAAGARLEGTGIRLGVEPLNTLIDHKGYFLDSTVEALDIIDEVGRPEIGIVYDVYHSAVMGEKTEEVVAGRIDRVFHVHVADHPGRNDPGSGGVDLRRRLGWLLANGYGGAVGLEYQPKMPSSESFAVAKRLLAG